MGRISDQLLPGTRQVAVELPCPKEAQLLRQCVPVWPTGRRGPSLHNLVKTRVAVVLSPYDDVMSGVDEPLRLTAAVEPFRTTDHEPEDVTGSVFLRPENGIDVKPELCWVPRELLRIAVNGVRNGLNKRSHPYSLTDRSAGCPIPPVIQVIHLLG